jgi:hypothetical protein
MNYKILGATGASVFLVVALLSSPMFYAMAQPSYTEVDSSSVTSNPAEKVYEFSVTTNGNIPQVADEYINGVLVFGYAWVDIGTSPVSAVVATIHPVAGRDSTQNPDNWHPHTAELASDADCGGGLKVVGLQSPTAGVAITGNTITVIMNANSATVSPSTFDVATGFTLVAGDNGALCVAAP